MTKHGTKIEWTHLPGYKGESWNPVGGCSHASSGCKNCYAERLAARLQAQKHPVYDGVISSSKRGPKFNGTVTAAPLDHPVWTQPLRWKKPRAIFVADMSDLFHEDRPDEHIDRVMAVAALCPQHIFMVLTKRPERMRAYLTGEHPLHRLHHEAAGDIDGKIAGTFRPWGNIYSLYLDAPWPLPNIWLGVSVEDQATADARIPHLLVTPAAIRFVSYEPALEHVMFREDWIMPGEPAGIDWIITGSESGPRARHCDLDWIRSVRDQCQAASIPFFWKQDVIYGRKISTPELDGKRWTQFPRTTA